MADPTPTLFPTSSPLVVAVVESRRGLEMVANLPPGAVDVCELRLDRLGCLPDADTIGSLALPWIATVRDPSEGGDRDFTATRRAPLFQQCVGLAAAIDVELENATARQELIREIQASNSSLILSFHDFQSAPDLKSARTLMRRAVDNGADIFKLAVTPQRPSEIGNLLELLDDPCIPVSLMAMGRWGLAARLLYAACGSVLNYGWVEEPVVSGQWEATELKKQLARVTSTGLTGGG